MLILATLGFLTLGIGSVVLSRYLDKHDVNDTE